MIKTSYQTPELRDANDNVVQEGAFGKNTALSNSTNDAWIDYVMNDLEALHDTIGDSAPTLDGNGHVVEPANLAIGDEDGVRLKTGYVKTSGGTVSGTLNVAQNLKMQDNQENVFGGMYVPASSATSQYLQVYGGETPSNNGGNLQLPSDGSWTLQAKNGTTAYNLVGGTDGTLKWRGNNVAVLASPAFTGNPTAPTQAFNNNSTRLANTAYVINELTANTPMLLDSLATVIPSGADLNEYKTPGTYRTNSASVTGSLVNCPYTSGAIKLVVMYVGYGGASYVMQLIFSVSQKIYVRSGANNTSSAWSEWKQLALKEDVLPLTGGTMTGNIIRQASTTANPFVLQRTDITKGEEVSAEKYNTALLVCANGSVSATTNRLAMIENVLYPSNNRLYFSVYQNVSSNLFANVFIEITTATAERFFAPGNDNNMNLGKSGYRWKQLYAGTTTISTSDERLKDNITAIPDEVLDAWGEVNWYQYQFKDSIAEKGETKARIHTGAIAQRIESVFESHGLDANKYGLLCYDEWKAEPAERDEDGNIVQEARPAGNRYSLRYEEALCMEAAYQRRRADRLEERIARLEALISE